MIQKWFKFNTTFAEIFKNIVGVNTSEQVWVLGNQNRQRSWPSLNTSHLPFKTSGTPSITRPIARRLDQSEKVTPARTELFQVTGPNESGFLIEVHATDLEGVKRELVTLVGENFRFEKAVIERFTVKCILRVGKVPGLHSERDQMRLSKIHAISSGCDEVYSEEGEFFFVTSVDKATRAKRILRKFGYTILEVFYRFQPRERVSLDDPIREACNQFVKAVEKHPNVISVTHNL